MAVYIAQAFVVFDGNDQSDAWALGQAQWIKDNTEVLTGQTLLVPGNAGERSSYCVVSEVQPDGSLAEISAWHVNDQGQITQGLPTGIPTPPVETDAWADGTAYVIDDVVTWDGGTYRCISPHTSDLAAGWTPAVASLWAVV